MGEEWEAEEWLSAHADTQPSLSSCGDFLAVCSPHEKDRTPPGPAWPPSGFAALITHRQKRQSRSCAYLIIHSFIRHFYPITIGHLTMHRKINEGH